MIFYLASGVQLSTLSHQILCLTLHLHLEQDLLMDGDVEAAVAPGQETGFDTKHQR